MTQWSDQEQKILTLSQWTSTLSSLFSGQQHNTQPAILKESC
jgi:hypothetical protein